MKKTNNVNGIQSQTMDVAFSRGGNKVLAGNVRSMMKEEKLVYLKWEMEQNKLNILGVCEVKWRDNGHFMSDGYQVIYSGGKEIREEGNHRR